MSANNGNGISGPMRVGVVSYLNARPLYWRLEEFAPGVELVVDVPSRLAVQLHEGLLDVALIPSIEYFRGQANRRNGEAGLTIIPGFAIAARSAVHSVKLFCRVPLHRIRRLALDEGSRTSQALTQVILQRKYGIPPVAVETHPLGVPWQESLADAVLLIGDRAMKADGAGCHEVLDLGEEWTRWTGDPFVFALWVARAGADLGDLPQALEHARHAGRLETSTIAAQFAERLGLDPAYCEHYLTSIISYDLGPPELRGLRRFAALTAALGLSPEGIDLVFHHHDHLASHVRR